MIDFIKELIRIVRNYERLRQLDCSMLDHNITEVLVLKRNMKTLEKLVRDRTEVAADINYRGPSSVIVVGRYKGADFIETYTLHDRDFHDLVSELRGKEQFGTVRTVDAPPSIKGVVMRSMRGGF